jgi:hypothetical protein
MKKLLFIPILLIALLADAQNLNLRYHESINFNSSKEEVIEIVLTQLRSYLQNDINGSATYLKKKKGINIKSGKNKEKNFSKLEEDIYMLLELEDNWSQEPLYRPYNLLLSNILGSNVTMPMFAGAGIKGAATFMVSFSRGYVSAVYLTKQTTPDYSIYSGFPYSNEHLADVATKITKQLGPFTYRQGYNTWNSCSTNPENVPVITYFITNGKYAAEMVTEYGVRQQRIAGRKGACRAVGNHLTSVTMRITKS